jgi:hypothetical protein
VPSHKPKRGRWWLRCQSLGSLCMCGSLEGRSS